MTLPEMRPRISIQPLDGVSFSVDFREDPWYFTVLETGEKTQWAIYDPPDWRRTVVSNMEVKGKAVVHGEEALEIQVDEYENGSWRENSARHYTQLGDQFIKYLAVLSYQHGIPHLDTFLMKTSTRIGASGRRDSGETKAVFRSGRKTISLPLIRKKRGEWGTSR